MDEKSALLYSKLNSYKYRVDSTTHFISSSLKKVRRPYVACSFGKDSSVMLDLILKIKPDIPVRFASHPETRILDNYGDVIKKWLDRGVNLNEIFCKGGLVKERHHQRKSLNGNPDDWDSYFVGIRKYESKDRKFSIQKHGMFFKLTNGRVRIAPIAHWTENDIVAYTLTNNLPVLSEYEHHGFSSRTSSGIPRTNISQSLNNLKIRDIHAFNRLCKLFQDVNNFA